MSSHYIKNFKSVLAFGDSHVAGCELSHKLSIEECLKNNISIETKPLIFFRFLIS
jgi:hypothetical protein